MFNDKFRLTELVFTGDKTMTRREARLMIDEKRHLDETADFDSVAKILINIRSPYHVGEDVAIAMSYEQAYATIQREICKINPNVASTAALDYKVWAEKLPGWTNKMFVMAKFMPFVANINEVRLERLQWISPGDCIMEGVRMHTQNKETFYTVANGSVFDTPRAAFQYLINSISGGDAWNTNNWQFVYHFSVRQSPFLVHQLSNVHHEKE